MRDPDRIEDVLEEIFRVWKRSPDLRLGQLLINATSFGLKREGKSDAMLVTGLFNLEEDKLVEYLVTFEKEVLK